MSEQPGHLLKGSVLYQVALWFLVPVVALGVLLGVMIFGGRPVDETTSERRNAARPEENYLAQVRSALSKQTDLATCRTVVQLLNSHLQRSQDQHAVAALPDDAARKLATQLGLDKDDLAEVAAQTYTPLDAHHLEACLLLRDVARSLEIPPFVVGEKTFDQTPLDRAQAAFAWVCRQVRLNVPELESVNPEYAPVAQVLRRGRGAPLERGLVFLALIEQFGLEEETKGGLQGCFILVPNAKGEKLLWACGVAVGDKPEALYLFDPRMGLPIPGPDKDKPATLAQVQKDPSLLGQWKIDKLSYDVTPEQVKAATVSLICPLSAVSARMVLLQERMLRDKAWLGQALPPAVRVKLSEDPARALATLHEAVKGQLKSGVAALRPEDVGFIPQGAGLLRRFLTKDEGGSDEGQVFDLRQLVGYAPPNVPAQVRWPRSRIYTFEAVPWMDMHPMFRESNDFRYDTPIGQRVRLMFASPFLRPLLEANSARDLLLRGRFSPAVQNLVQEREVWDVGRSRSQSQDTRDLPKLLADWAERARPAHVELLRAQKGTPEEAAANAAVEALWRFRPGDAMEVALLGSIAVARGSDVIYQLALCRHEQAARHQMRADLAARAGLPPGNDALKARKDWGATESYWKEFVDGNATRPAVAAGRRLHAETLARTGNLEEASKRLQDVSGPMSELEKLASLWLAKQLAARKGP